MCECVGRVCGPESVQRWEVGSEKERVEHPDCLVDIKTVFEAAGVGPETLQVPEAEETGRRVGGGDGLGETGWGGGVACSPGGFAGEVNVLQGGEGHASGCRVHHHLLPLVHIQVETVALAPCDQAAHLKNTPTQSSACSR